MLRNAIEVLAQNYDTPIEELIEYKEVLEKNKNDPEVFNIIQEQFRPTIVKIGTAGAYLWGCDQNFYGNVSKSCSALCNGGISYNNENTCQYQIWTYDEKLESRGEVSSSSAYIYVSENWIGFKNDDIEILKNSNVNFVTVLTTENSKHKSVIPITQVDNLPIIKEYLVEEIEVKSYKTYYIFFFVLVLTIVIYLTLNFYKYF